MKPTLSDVQRRVLVNMTPEMYCRWYKLVTGIKGARFSTVRALMVKGLVGSWVAKSSAGYTWDLYVLTESGEAMRSDLLEAMHQESKQGGPQVSETTEGPALDTWAYVEVMGHRQLAGRVREVRIAGVGMLQVDVPETEHSPAFTQYVGAASIFAITPTSEEKCREAAALRYRYGAPDYVALPPPSPIETDASELDPHRDADLISELNADGGDEEE